MTNPLGLDVGIDVDFSAKFDAAIGRLATTITTEMMRAEQRRLMLIPNPVAMEGLLTPGAATTALWNFGTPQMGRKWELRLWSLDSQPDGSNTSNFLLLVGANTVAAQVGQQVTGFPAAAVLTTSMRWRFNQAPNQKDFSGSVITIKAGQNLMVACLGAPALTNVSIAVAFDDMMDQSARGSVATV